MLLDKLKKILPNDGNEYPKDFQKIVQNLSSFINLFLIGPLRKYRSVKAATVAYCMANCEPNDGIRYLYFDDFHGIDR